MLARSVLRYRFFDLRNVPTAEQLGALRGQLVAWQPFPESCFWVQWREGHASVHACAAETLGQVSPRATVWPESCLHAPLAQGLRLVVCVEGYEGQYWHEGLLRASQWWAAMPGEADWISFVRASGSPPTPLPTAESLDWCVPHPRVQPLERLSQSAMAPARTLVSALFVALLGLTSYVAHDYWEAQQEAEAAAAELRQLRTKSEPVTKARERAMAARAVLEATVKPLWAPQPLEVLDHLSRQLPKGVLLREFDLQGLEVHVLLETPPDLARSQLFEALESGEWFTKVTEQAGARNGISLQFRLNGVRPPVAVQAPAGVTRRSTDAAELPKLPPALVPPGGK